MSQQFDDLYLASRRRLVLQAYALTGDLGAARRAVTDAFVAARDHWRVVSALADPEEWVRSRAWVAAQRRHATRPWHREKGLPGDQARVLEALHDLGDQQRRALLLSRLAGLSDAAVARELDVPPDVARTLLAGAASSYLAGTGAVDVRESLETLAPVAEAAALPHAAELQHGGVRRRRVRVAVGTAAVLALTLLGGAFVSGGTSAAGPARTTTGASSGHDDDGATVTSRMLLGLTDLAALVPGQQWRPGATTDNTGGTGINSVCQDSRFADPDGLSTLVRTFTAVGTPRRRLVQTVEVSGSAKAAEAAYGTTVGWFAGCREARLQLLNAYRVDGLGGQAQLLTLRIPRQVRRTYVVGVARTGTLTVSTVVETLGGRPPEVESAVRVLTRAVTDLCASEAAGECPATPRVAPVLPPPSGETPGTLAAADLPVIGRINHPWMGTDPVPARTNLAATTCDKTSFVRAGAVHAMTRTFLIPQARLPRRFGITETFGTFGSTRKARDLVRRVEAAMAGCERKDLGAEVSSALVTRQGYRGSEYALWRLDSEIDDERRTVGFWMGIARVDNHVAQVTFTPTGVHDVEEETFRALVTRARDRLFELGGTATR